MRGLYPFTVYSVFHLSIYLMTSTGRSFGIVDRSKCDFGIANLFKTMSVIPEWDKLFLWHAWVRNFIFSCPYDEIGN